MATLEQSELKKYPCPGCGATLEFNPKAGQLKCPYCGCEEVTPKSDHTIEERSYDFFVNADCTTLSPLSATAQQVNCPGCKAQVTFEPPYVAKECPFCSTSIVNQPRSANPVLAPEAILPFQIDKKKARDRLQKWIGSLWFAPTALKKQAQYEKMQGIYLPFWTYDCQTHSQYRGERGEHYYKTRKNDKGEEERVRHTRWHPASGQVSRFFDDVLVPATTSVNANRLEQLEPWDLSKLAAYDPSYLAGFQAQRYQVSLQQGFEKAKTVMKSKIESDVRRQIGGDEQRVHNVNTEYSQRTFKHLLLPVWLSSYRFNNKQFQIMVNAQTGEVVGDRPYSALKIAAAVMAALLLIGTIGFVWHKIDTSQSPQPNGTEQPSN